MTEMGIFENDTIRTGNGPVATQKAAAPRLPCAERENRLERLKSRWTSPQRLRTHHLKIVQEIKSLEQGHDGKVAVCCFCKRLLPVDTFDVHHLDHDVNNNVLANLDVGCGPENDKENAAWRAMKAAASRLADPASVSVRSPDGGALTRYEITDDIDADNFSEGRKHEEQRARWSNWIHDLENGIFRGIGATIRRQMLADKAVYGLSKDDQPYGSSVTYLRFIREDTAGGIFEQYKEGGIIFVRYLGPRKASKQQQVAEGGA